MRILHEEHGIGRVQRAEVTDSIGLRQNSGSQGSGSQLGASLLLRDI